MAMNREKAYELLLKYMKERELHSFHGSSKPAKCPEDLAKAPTLHA